MADSNAHLLRRQQFHNGGKPVRTLLDSPSATGTAATTSAWSFISWAFFCLATLATVGIGAWWVALRPAAADPHVGPATDVFAVFGMGIAWWVAMACKALGSLCGLIGIASPSGRTSSARVAVVLNGVILVVSLVLLMVLSP